MVLQRRRSCEASATPDAGLRAHRKKASETQPKVMSAMPQSRPSSQPPALNDRLSEPTARASEPEAALRAAIGATRRVGRAPPSERVPRLSSDLCEGAERRASSRSRSSIRLRNALDCRGGKNLFGSPRCYRGAAVPLWHPAGVLWGAATGCRHPGAEWHIVSLRSRPPVPALLSHDLVVCMGSVEENQRDRAGCGGATCFVRPLPRGRRAARPAPPWTAPLCHYRAQPLAALRSRPRRQRLGHVNRSALQRPAA